MDPDELTERLNERREKLNYFIVTASIAIIAFTLKTALDARTVFVGWRLALVGSGSFLLLIAAGGSLWMVRLRHAQSWRYIDLAKYKEDVAAANRAMEPVLEQMKSLAFWMHLVFIVGVLVIAAGYMLAIAAGDP